MEKPRTPKVSPEEMAPVQDEYSGGSSKLTPSGPREPKKDYTLWIIITVLIALLLLWVL